MLAYRITHKDFSRSLYASGMAGRWNSVGKKVIYCAESIPLAFLENMVRRQGVGFNNDFKILIIEIPDDLAVDTIHPADLKKGWRNFNNYSQCQALGNQWIRDARTPVIKVPSAVIPQAFNFVINTEHPEYKKIKLLKTTDLAPDPRIEDLLKKYAPK